MEKGETNMTGVCIGRFQVPYLHLGHIHLISTALQECADVVILLGCQKKKDARNPYSLEERRRMIRRVFPQVEIRALDDHPGDDMGWSNEVDDNCKFFPNPILYHSRDSFQGHYKGRLPMKEVEEIQGYSGTNLRKNEQEDSRNGVGFEEVRTTHQEDQEKQRFPGEEL